MAVALALAIVTAPIAAAVAAGVRIRLGSPVLFAQERTGRGGRSFRMVKFRSMTSETDENGVLLPDSDRITRFGAFLRSTSLDELPELWNVVLGQMSLVGPRPLPVRYTQYFTETERRRLEVRPGITGLAQVIGRNELPWDDRLATDVRYVEACSLRLDVRILMRTLRVAVSRRGLQVDPGSHMQDFDVERSAQKTVAPPGGGTE